MKKLLIILFCLVGLTAMADEQGSFDAEKFLKSLNYQTGTIDLPNGVASLNIPKGYFYLSPEDSERLLVDAWGNPPGQNVLGMIMPSNVNPLSAESWAVTIDYLEDGYVSDEDADDIDYDELLQNMKEQTAENSAERVKNGYEPIELLGWAAKPHYNAESKKLYWAKEYKFGNGEHHTLNYDIRMLGRKGVLEMNFIADMAQLPEINNHIDSVLGMAEFKSGLRYADFNPDLDKVAAYGLGTLVAGKLAAKAGLFAIALVFLKKFWIIIAVFFGGLFSKIFRRNKAKDEPAA